MANFLSQNWLLNRRHVLQGFGVSLALPLLDCMRPLCAAETKSRPKRSVFIYLPNGVNTAAYEMNTAGVDYKLSKPLESLAKHRKIITPISGMHHPHGLGNHHNCSTIWLTGGKIGQSERNTISVDQLMSQVTAPQTRYSSIEMSNQGHSLAYTADGISLPAQASPGVVFRDMFTEPQGGTAKQRRGLQRRGSILDAILGEATTLGNQLGQDDRGRLEQYLTSVREVEVRAQRADKWLDTPRPTIDSAVQAQLNRDISLERLGEYLRTMYDIIVLAFQTDMTRVASFSTGNEGIGPAVPEIGVKQDRHSLSHHNGNPKLMEDLQMSDAFNIKQFAYFLDRLSTVSDANGPLIESTMALYGSGMAYGHSHGNASLPLILAGGTQLGLKHGTHVDFNLIKEFKGYDKHPGIYHNPVNSKARMSNLLLTMAQKMDVPTETFGDSTGTVSEILA
ncbi:MAG: hypothetical protein JWM11_2521 [Planctomycetaceae bacterium]|nr:hypothetical protein [Planctomycetaceae bacterium]